MLECYRRINNNARQLANGSTMKRLRLPAFVLSLAFAAGPCIIPFFLQIPAAGQEPAADVGPDKIGGFTLVVIPDTQIYSYNDPSWRKSSREEVFMQMTKWIADNVHRHNIRFALHMGDIVTTYDRPEEWSRADKAMSLLDGIVPYCFTVGNHDLAMDGADVRDSNFFNQTFPYTRYQDQPWYGGRLENDDFLPRDNYDNSYHFFTAAGQKYLIVSLEVGPTDRMLDWADGVIARHPNHRVIVMTHSYMDGHDVRDGPGGYGYLPPGAVNTGEEIWQKLIRKHRSIFFVLNGHLANKDGHRGLLASRGDHGNRVYQLLSGEDYDGWLRLLHFVPAEDKIVVKTYSPWKPENPADQFQQYDFDLPGYRVDAAHDYELEYEH